MSCPEIAELSSYFDAADNAARPDLAQHAACCARCRLLLQRFARVRASLEPLRCCTAPAHLTPPLAAALRPRAAPLLLRAAAALVGCLTCVAGVRAVAGATGPSGALQTEAIERHVRAAMTLLPRSSDLDDDLPRRPELALLRELHSEKHR
jgi:hypothetical protein